MFIEEAVSVIKSKKTDHLFRPFIIAISGFGGSGKTTLAKKIKDNLGNCEIVSIDSFITGLKWERSEDWSNFDKDRFKTKILENVISNKFPIIYEYIRWPGTKSGKKIVLNKSKYLIVEGCSIFHPELTSYFDLKIWLDVSIELATKRGKQRDLLQDNNQIVTDLWDNLFKPNENDFYKKYRPDEVADILINHNTKMVVDSTIEIFLDNKN